MGTTGEPTRVRDDIARLAHRDLPVAKYARAVGDTLLRAVPAEGSCLTTVDPATWLPTAEFVENGLPAPELVRLLEIEVSEPDINKWVHLARAPRPAASLSEATSGDLNRSVRHREIRRPGGFADELRVVLGRGTAVWGELTIFRAADQPWFSASEVQLVSTVAGTIAEGLRRDVLLEQVRSGAGDVGMLVLDAEDSVTMSNPAADRWLEELAAGNRAGTTLPLVVAAVARRARATCSTAVAADLDPARARARTRSGQWLTVRGSVMGDAPDDPVTIVLEAARPAEMAPLMVAAYGFTAAERHVTELVARGLSTTQIADQLHLSTYTVQDRLKAIFEKSDTSSRGQLVARLFIDHQFTQLGPRSAI